MGAPELCVDSSRNPVFVSECSKDVKLRSGDQNFTLTWHKDMRKKGDKNCWDISDPNDKAEVTLYGCHGSGGNQYWKYDVV